MVMFFSREGLFPYLDHAIQILGQNKGDVIFLEGEEGIGKSTTLAEMGRRAERDGLMVIRCSCFPESSPYHLFIQALNSIGVAAYPWEKRVRFDCVFVIDQAGLVLAHSENKETGLDEDIVGGMISAVQNFVKDSFEDQDLSEEGGLGKLEYKDRKIMIEHGRQCFIVGVITGEENPDMRKDLRQCISGIERELGDLISSWKGNVDALGPVNESVEALLERNYLVKSEAVGIKLEKEMFRIGEETSEIFDEYSEKTRVVLTVDDVHWVDEGSLYLLKHLIRTNVKRKMIIVASSEPGTDGFERFVDELDAVGGSRVIISPFSEEELVKFIEFSELLVNEELIMEIYRRSGGNPSLVSEFLNLIRVNAISDVDELDNVISSEASTLSALLSSKVERLNEDELELAEFLASMPGNLDVELLSEVLDDRRYTKEKVANILNDLIVQNILRAEKDALTFQMPRMRNIIYEGIGERWRCFRHKHLGEVIESSDATINLYDLAYHFGRSHEFYKALKYNLQAGNKAADVYAPGKAIEYLDLARNIIESNKTRNPDDIERLPVVMEKIGDMHKLTGSFEPAIMAYRSVIERTEGEGCARLYRKIGFVYDRKNEVETALKTFDEGLAYLKDRKTLEAGRILVGKGISYWRIGKFNEALEHAVHSLSILEGQEFADEDIGFAYNLIGNVYADKGENELAIENYEKGLAARERGGVKDGISASLNNIGNVYADLGEYVNALSYYDRALELKEEIGDLVGVAVSNINMGALLTDLNQVDEAIKRLDYSIAVSERGGFVYPLAYTNLGRAKLHKNDLNGAIQVYGKGLEIVRKKHDKVAEASCHCGLAEAYALTEEFGKAKEELDLARIIICEHGLKKYAGMVEKLEGDVLIAEGKTGEGLNKYQASIRTFSDGGFIADVAEVRRNLAGKLIEIGEKELAKQELAKAIEIYRKVNSKINLEACETLLKSL
jgi:tetratricopeptide (TPR) repeat protein